MDLTVIKKIAFELIGDKRSHEWKDIGNKYYHGERVAKLAITIRKIIFPGNDSHDDVLTVAAWFHDIMNGVENHAVEGAVRAREVLADYCSSVELDEICEIISLHDDRYSDRDKVSDYAKLHQDADILDHFGTFYIWINFLYAVPHGITMNETIDWLIEDQPASTIKYREVLNFDISKEIFDEKTEFAEYFVKRFAHESSGSIWNEAELLR